MSARESSPANLLLSGWTTVRQRMQELSSTLGFASEQGGREGSKPLSSSSSAELLSPGKGGDNVEQVFEGLRSKRSAKLRGDYDFE